MNSQERQAVVAEALSWERTPYHPHGRVKGVGVDCAMFPAEVYAAAGIIAPIEPQEYPVDWHMHRDQERFLSAVLAHARPTENMHPGNLVLYRWGRTFAHSGIIVAWPTIIHAMMHEGVCRADGTAGELANRRRLCFTLGD